MGLGLLFWTRAREGKSTAKATSAHLADWDAAKAAAYLDSREVYWQSWEPAKRDQGTVCISCHTVLPYAMARPELRRASSETGTTSPEKVLIASIQKRVTNWDQIQPVYSEQVGPGKAAQSRATEAVLNAVILASYDTRQGHLLPVTRKAFDEVWALQEVTGPNAGGWKWQDFHLAPWESGESAYQGAALLAVKTQNAPDGYATGADAQRHLESLGKYLQRGYSSQPVINQLFVFWASAKSPPLLTAEQRKAFLDKLRSLQQRDGGWSLAAMDQAPNLDKGQWLLKQIKMAFKPPPSDGCATGLVALVLEESGIDRQDPMLQRGLQWLEQHQNSDGSWSAASLNKQRNPETNVGHFMSDAATGYAVMALEEAH
jgi:hypothetical protein